jgi:predicted Zn-dependent protease
VCNINNLHLLHVRLEIWMAVSHIVVLCVTSLCCLVGGYQQTLSASSYSENNGNSQLPARICTVCNICNDAVSQQDMHPIFTLIAFRN